LPTDFQELSFTSPRADDVHFRHLLNNNLTTTAEQTKNARDRYLAQAFRD
jgi:hypothetical protein